MAITSKQRSFLRGLAQNADTIIQIGKGGITESVKESVSDALNARELVKGKVLEKTIALVAFPLWEIAFFSSGVSSALLLV